ncbi:MAG: YebC/PmpR family DNA-binding transcriptional regulator [Verrucomicrobia bacterium]|nr:YebC/PmpR family DNA-binding transcriptional regulator [Verrucomicrobiota bacterium]
MSGHSKWANIKHKKAAADNKRGRIFSKLAKEIMVVARHGGGDPAANIALRTLIQKARGFNMPADNIDRAIKKGTGELEGAALEEMIYEGYASGGVAVIVEALSDNRNRTAADVRHAFTKHNASFSGQGSVARSFQRKGLILVKADAVEEEKLMELVLEAGAEDMNREGDEYEIVAEPSVFMDVVDVLNAAEVPIENSEVTLLPDTYMEITDAGQAAALMRFVEALEDLDDVQNVYTNLDISDAAMAAIGEG